MSYTCIQYNSIITCTNFVTCSCNSAIHFKCLNAHNSLPYNWITSSALLKHVVSVLKSPSFKFSCQICLQKPSLIPSPTIPPLSTTMTDLLNTLPFLIKDISTRLDQQDLTLLNISSQLSNNKSNYKYSTIHITPPTSSIPLPSIALSNIKCTFNNYTKSFELRHLTNSKIDWNKNPMYISNDTYNTWSTSYNTYKLNIKSLTSSISDSQSSHQSAQ